VRVLGFKGSRILVENRNQKAEFKNKQAGKRKARREGLGILGFEWASPRIRDAGYKIQDTSGQAIRLAGNADCGFWISDFGLKRKAKGKS
jgi:hypothetical protein